jgi:peptidoglycan/LPS O-acetylase OafA/YrhL
MELSITNMIKDVSRQLDEETEMSKSCLKLYKRIMPLKWLALTLLIALPWFEFPTWC